jgi:hypothetical protein
MYVVQKAFGGPKGRRFEPNELIDAEGFRNLPLLIEQRYLRVATKDEIESAEEEDIDEDEDLDEDDEDEEVEEEVMAVAATRKSAPGKRSTSTSSKSTSKSSAKPMALKKGKRGGR